MFSRLLSVPLLIGAAVGVPYVASNGPNIDGLFNSIASKTQHNGTQHNGTQHNGTQTSAFPRNQDRWGPIRPQVPQGPGAALYPNETPLEGLPSLSLHDVFNMNVSKEWVYQRWARKSTALSELGLFGIRVPLVTGTQLHDLAGSLTYFFGNDGRVHRISFHGTTGDTTQLVMLAAQRYGLQQQSTRIAGEQLFQLRRQNQIFSELRTRPAPVLWTSSPHDSFAVDLELQRPGATGPLPSRLPPLPVVQAPPLQEPAPVAANPAASQASKPLAKVGKAEKTVEASEKWKPFFPRSRVPNKQVDNLDRHRRLW